MQGDNWDFSDAVDARVWPWTRRQVGYGTNVKVVTERGLGSFSRLGGLAGKREDDLINELGACQPVQIGDSPQHGWGKRQVVIQKAAHDGTVERIIAQCPRDGASDRTPANDEDLAQLGFAAPPPPCHLP